MKNTTARMTSIGLAAAFLVSALAIFVPTAVAQGEKKLTIQCCDWTPDADLPNGRILPDTGIAYPKVSGKVIIPAASYCLGAVTVNFVVSQLGANYASTAMLPSTIVTSFSGAQQKPIADQQYEVSFTAKLQITVNREAPAFQDGSYEVTVTAKAQGTSTSGGTCTFIDADPAKTKYVLKNDYLPLTNVNAIQLFVKTGQNKKATFPVEITNLGNGPTRVKIELVPSGKNRLDSYNGGGELRLASKAGKTTEPNAKATRNIEVTTPHSNGYTNSIYSFIGTFTSSYDGTAPGVLAEDKTSITFNVQVQGVYVPGFDSIGMLAALSVGLLLLGRRARAA